LMRGSGSVHVRSELLEPATLSRGQFLKAGAGLVGGIALLGAPTDRGFAAKPSFEPKPIPGGFDSSFAPVPSNPLVHVLPPALGFEMSTITDLHGVVGAAEIRGTARGSDRSTYTFDTDMRFMRGRFLDVDGRLRDAAFVFV
jgi:hypothetical protein